jgi:hypothetical protein
MGSVVAISNNLSSSSNPPRGSLTPMQPSTRLASVVLTEPQLFQFDSTAGVGVSGKLGGGIEGGGGAAGIVVVPSVDNPFVPSPDSIIDSLSDTVNDMLGHDVSQCYSPEAELLQYLSQQHLVLAQLSYLMDSACAPKYLLDRIISHLRFASIGLLPYIGDSICSLVPCQPATP